MENELNVLSSRAGFNTALRHFKNVTAYVSEISGGANLADLINASIDDGVIERFQVKTILNALLIDKFGYVYRSHNLEQNLEKADQVIDAVSEWGNVHIILSYQHPQAGLFVLNPKNRPAWESVLPLIRDELIIIYAGPSSDTLEPAVLEAAADDFIKLLYGRKVKPKKEYLGERRAGPQPEAKPVAEVVQPVAAPRRRVTPRYSVQVTNELFHNGNVEAWKKIVDSYKTNYSDLDVLIWYENERINDINALFKWGKVKHGGLIFFSVSGENIKDVSKLQRYLFEGASPRFEAFLKGSIGQVLDLF